MIQNQGFDRTTDLAVQTRLISAFPAAAAAPRAAPVRCHWPSEASVPATVTYKLLLQAHRFRVPLGVIDGPFELTIYFLASRTPDHHDHDSPDFVDIEIPQAARVASSRELASFVIMHESNTATSICARGCREPVIGLIATM